MTYTVTGASVIAIAVAVWFLGTAINRKIPFLTRYNIPVSVTGGLLCSTVVATLHYTTDINIVFDTELRDILLLVFFTTIGLSAKLKMLLEGGKVLVLLVVAAVCLLILQNTTGVLAAFLLGNAPGYGLFGGSISLAGGYGTAIAWGQSAAAAGLAGAQEVGIAFATFGLIAGGIMGGPIAQGLIRHYKLRPGYLSQTSGGIADIGSDRPPVAENKADTSFQKLPTISSSLGMIMAIFVCVEAGDLVNKLLASNGFALPGFFTAMLVGIIITNGADIFKIRLDPVSRQRAEELSLQLFLAMSLMSMQLWILADAFGKILFVLFAQMTVITLFTVFVVFRLAGKDYDASVMAAGFAGLGMGATPVGIANMNAVTSKYGPSPKAFLVIPLVGAFFLDIANALVIKTFLSFSFMQ